MDDKLATAQQAALGFARRLRPQDLGAGHRLRQPRRGARRPSPATRAELEHAIHKTVAGGSTSLYNAIYIALKELKKVQRDDREDIRRQAIVVLSDGEDTSSLVAFEEVLDLAKRSETAIYAIGLRSPSEIACRGATRTPTSSLRQLAQQTGGRAFFPTRIEDLPASTARLPTSCRASTSSGSSSKNPKRDGALAE